MPFEVTIIRNSDGATVVYIDEADWGEGSEFYWNEGSMACDCNRAVEFHRARGEEIPDRDGTTCGDHRFSVKLPPITW